MDVAFGLDPVQTELRRIADGVLIRAGAAKGLLDALEANGGGRYSDTNDARPGDRAVGGKLKMHRNAGEGEIVVPVGGFGECVQAAVG